MALYVAFTHTIEGERGADVNGDNKTSREDIAIIVIVKITPETRNREKRGRALWLHITHAPLPEAAIASNCPILYGYRNRRFGFDVETLVRGYPNL